MERNMNTSSPQFITKRKKSTNATQIDSSPATPKRSKPVKLRRTPRELQAVKPITQANPEESVETSMVSSTPRSEQQLTRSVEANTTEPNSKKRKVHDITEEDEDDVVILEKETQGSRFGSNSNSFTPASRLLDRNTGSDGHWGSFVHTTKSSMEPTRLVNSSSVSTASRARTDPKNKRPKTKRYDIDQINSDANYARSLQSPPRRRHVQNAPDDEESLRLALRLQEEEDLQIAQAFQSTERVGRGYRLGGRPQGRYTQPRFEADFLDPEYAEQHFSPPPRARHEEPHQGFFGFLSGFARRLSGGASRDRTDPNLLALSMMNREFNANDYDMLLALDEGVKNKGAKNAEINQLPIHIVQEGETTSDCCICMCSVEAGAKVRRLPCLHFFHAECIDQWLKVNKVCPIDKQPIK